MRIEVAAPAKINLTLHVTGQRFDGYHELDSLVVFADVGDRLVIEPARALSLSVTGPRAAAVPEGAGNLVLRAARLFDAAGGASITLEKHLPAAAGIGGGSSDAAAALRGLARLWGRGLPDRSADLGADLPVCLLAQSCRMRGIGEVLEPAPWLPRLAAVLVNPGEAVPTPEVFAALASRANPAMTDYPPPSEPERFCTWLAMQRNDLQEPAMALAPVIRGVLDALSDARLARMSGSGATCFGIYPDMGAARRAAARISARHGDWWVAPTMLGQLIRDTT